jgi:hypothetical protein
MQYCGLQVSTKSTHVYIENEHGRQVKRAVVATTSTALAATLGQFAIGGVTVAAVLNFLLYASHCGERRTMPWPCSTWPSWRQPRLHWQG